MKVWTKGLLRFLAFVITLLCTSASRAAPAGDVPDLAWQPPSELRVFRWHDKRSGARLVRSVDPALGSRLLPEELAAIPVGSGALVRVEGHGIRVGLGTGSEDLPDAITWLPPRSGADVQELRVPNWSSARTLVVRGARAEPTSVKLWVAVPREEPMAWYRADEQVAAWLFAGEKPPHFTGPLEIMNRAVSFLQAAERALGRVPAPRRAAWLQARWLELSYAERPVPAPFFSPSALELKGGTVAHQPPAARELDPTQEHRELKAGERLRIEAEAASLITLLTRHQAVGRSVIRVSAGDSVWQTLEVTIPRRAQDPRRWTPPRLVRVPIHRTQPVTVEVLRGVALVSVKGYRQRTGLLDLRAKRDRTALLGRANLPAEAAANPSRHEAWFSLLVELSLTKSRAAASRLQTLAAAAGLSAAERALTWHELVAADPTSDAGTLRALGSLRDAARSLPAEPALPLFRSALERAVATLPGPIEDLPKLGDVSISALASRPTLQDEVERIAVLERVLDPPRDGGRPAWAARAEVRAAAAPQRSELKELARLAWYRGAPWAVQGPEEDYGVVTRLEPVFDAAPGELCHADGPEGHRWLFIDREPLALTVTHGVGSHRRALLQSAHIAPQPDAWLLIDDTRVSVHTGAGLGSSAAIAPGLRRFAVAHGSDVVAHLPFDDAVPCSRLRDAERWVNVLGSRRFTLRAGDAPTVASILVDPLSLEERERVLRVHVGRDTLEGWVRPESTGPLEFLVPPGATFLDIESDRRVLVRLRARLHPRPSTPRKLRAAQPQPPADIEALLEEVRRTTYFIRRATAEEGRAKLRLQRALALQGLGYERLADIDRERSSEPLTEPSPSSPKLDALDDLELPPGSAPVIPLGRLAKIAPLPLPDRLRWLNRAVLARANGAYPQRTLAELESSAETSVATDALLSAVLFEQTGDLPRAAAVLERIGRAHASAEALAWSADLYTDAASAAEDPTMGLRGYLVARSAVSLGATLSGTLARLDPSVEWRPVAPESAAGLARVQQAFTAAAEMPSLSEQVRRALLDAPGIARLLDSEPTSVGLSSVTHGALELEILCHALSGPAESCRYWLSVDERPATCVGGERSLGDGVARPRTCRVEVPPGARRLTITPPPGLDAVGFVVLRRLVDDLPLPVTTSSNWHEADARRPVELVVSGPTVLRLRARSTSAEPSTLDVRVTTLADGVALPPLLVELDGTLDPFARVGDGAKVGQASVVYVPIFAEGPVSVLVTPKTRALLRADLAIPGAPPRKREPAEVPATEEAPRVWREWPLGPRPPSGLVGWDPPVGPLTVSGYFAAVSRNVLEFDHERGDRYLELGAGVSRDLFDETAFASLGVFQRLRDGPESYGAELGMTVNSARVGIGGYARSRIVAQPRSSGLTTGILASAGVLGVVNLDTEWAVSPGLSLTLRSPSEDARGETDVDHDVYTAYARTRPTTLDALVHLGHRPAVDALFRYTVSSRFVPGPNVMDRSDVRARSRLLFGAGLWPYVEVDAVLSYRPESELRSRSFVRGIFEPSMFLWHWQGRNGRLSLSISGSYFRDFPAVTSSGDGLSGMLRIGYDFTWGRGLADASPGDRPFRERLEEDLVKASRKLPRRHPYWGPLDE